MSFAIVFFSKTLEAKAALEGLDLLMHLENVLVQICLLRKSASTAIMGANEGLLLSVAAHVVEKFRRIRDQSVAALAELALKEPKRVKAIRFLLELKYNIIFALW